MPKRKAAALMPVERITRSILILRRQRVLLDRDLAEIYGVSTSRLNEAVKRNAARFPADFMFQLTEPETQNLRSQIAISSWGGRRYRPFVFSEYGAIQAANVLRSERAIALHQTGRRLNLKSQVATSNWRRTIRLGSSACSSSMQLRQV